MGNILHYKGYIGSVEIAADEAILFGSVQGIREKLEYSAKDAEVLIARFRQVIDDYLKTCKEMGRDPEIPYKGSFNIRISPHLHRRLAIYAMQHKTTINRTIERILASYDLEVNE